MSHTTYYGLLALYKISVAFGEKLTGENGNKSNAFGRLVSCRLSIIYCKEPWVVDERRKKGEEFKGRLIEIRTAKELRKKLKRLWRKSTPCTDYSSL